MMQPADKIPHEIPARTPDLMAIESPMRRSADLEAICDLIRDNCPRAWLGISRLFDPPAARICYRCPDRERAEKLAAALEIEPTHGLCPLCFAFEMAANVRFAEGRR